jgi:tetraprenyl-beta-curcumene synthase
MAAGRALVIANGRYWSSVAPLVRAQRQRWERRAQAMPDGRERELASAKLREEFFNAEVAATLATLATRRHRHAAVEAIVALEVLYDYLDGLSEGLLEDPLGDGAHIYAPLLRAVGKGARTEGSQDSYTEELAETAREALSRLPRWQAVREVAETSAAMCAQAQVHIHAIPALGTHRAQQWAQARAGETGLGWRETLAGGASSVLAVHALIAAAADERTTRAHARAIAQAYLRIGVAITLLDSLVDHEADLAAGEAGFIKLYEEPDVLAPLLSEIVGEAAAQTRELPCGAHHVMTLIGAVAYWTTAPGATAPLVVPVARRLRRELGPTMLATVALMQAWRCGRRVSRR